MTSEIYKIKGKKVTISANYSVIGKEETLTRDQLSKKVSMLNQLHKDRLYTVPYKAYNRALHELIYGPGPYKAIEDRTAPDPDLEWIRDHMKNFDHETHANRVKGLKNKPANSKKDNSFFLDSPSQKNTIFFK